MEDTLVEICELGTREEGKTVDLVGLSRHQVFLVLVSLISIVMVIEVTGNL